MGKNSDTLLDYVLKLDVRTPTADANTDYLRACVVVVKPKSGVETGTLSKVISATAAAELTANADVEQLFAGGLNYCYVLPMSTLDLSTALASAEEKFNTLLISADFTETEMASLKLGDFDGVVAAAFTTQAQAKDFSALKNHVAFMTSATNGAANMFYAFGNLLGGVSWDNKQYLEMPKDDGITDITTAESLYQDGISFVLTSAQYGPRLAFFACGGQAIIAPYVTKELMANLQGAALQYLNLNRPKYTLVQAKLLEDYLMSDAITRYVPDTLAYVNVEITLTKNNYEGTVSVTIPEPSALWKLKGILTQEAY